MKTYIYQDEKSHKFWAVEQQENELHISWGKVGTNGQSQIKSFADAAAAEKAELKLIAEKTKKGYAEEVSVTTPTSAPVQVIACSEKAPLPQDKPPFAEDHLPWLADDAQIILPTEVAPTTLSHRRWPGDSVPQENELTLLRSVAAHTHRRFKKVITFDYSTCSLDWQQAITQAVGLIDSPISTALPPMVLAVLVALEQGFNRNDHEELMDQIVQEGGLEYATEVVIALQAIRFDWNYDAHLITFTPDNKQPGYLSRFASVEMRLRKHLSLANDDVWQRCADKLIAALGNIPAWHQPLVALLLPEKQDVSHEIARRLCGQKGLYALEWLKLTAADEQVLAELGKYGTVANS
ncbi:WGR domain-containing protein, partial [Escherichia coli]